MLARFPTSLQRWSCLLAHRCPAGFVREKVGEMYDRRLDMGDRLNSIDGRLHMLDEHIRHMGYYLEHGEIYRQYSR